MQDKLCNAKLVGEAATKTIPKVSFHLAVSWACFDKLQQNIGANSMQTHLVPKDQVGKAKEDYNEGEKKRCDWSVHVPQHEI